MLYFTSDIHFADENTLKFDRNPFKNIRQYDKTIIRTINKTAKKSDILYVIGDFFDCDGPGFDSYLKASKYIKKIKPKLFLIIGNNEERLIKYYFNNDYELFKKYCLNIGFVGVEKSLHLRFSGKDFYLVHKPQDCIPWHINLFGHAHSLGGSIYKDFGFNVGISLNHFRIYSQDDILYLLAQAKRLHLTNDTSVNIM